ncbi:TonB-dependent receptor [Parabacteroides sp. PF5-6]|uniref:SusC/RagA family TonB-linked outer membrane protein n=1 Tax=Parabacteroides sp. PF5-6 TaxID=1742403 RepID=UPI0024060682|nr:TonB-dependent receptor [Parabacteroides sp. PF5-6]MDF9830831.1 TonB-linked SusC/RagA family outer membrane protein [Parabacteroides sp. PF5-6]
MQRKKMFSSFRHCRLALLTVLMSFSIAAAHAQSGTVVGKILDELGEPIIGANVMEKGTTNGTVTNLDGDFSLNVSNTQRAVLQISFIGYNTVEEALRGRGTISVTLEPSVVNLGEVVAIGYGTQTRREITGSIANVSEEDFNKGITRDASDLLQGKVAGLVITSGSGDVSRESQIRLRGTSTLQNDMGPLVVIDGIPGGEMSSVAPNDIESISVLKDASSAAIYGSRGAGGVILITTKRGSGSRTQINYNGYVSADVMANKPKLMDASKWREYAKASGQDYAVYDQYGADTDWFDELTRTGISQNHGLSMSGGTSKSNYRASYNFLDRTGIMRDNDMTRHSFRFQFQQRAINDRLRIGLTGSATITEMNLPRGQNFVLAYSMLPVYPVFNADGSYFTKVNSEYDQGNPVQNQDLNQDVRNNVFFYGAGDIQFEILQGLLIKSTLYTHRASNERGQFNNSATEQGQGDSGWARKTSNSNNRNLMEWMLDYNTEFGAEGKHKLNAMLGYSWEENVSTSFYATNRGFLVNDLSYNSLQSGTGLKTGDVNSSKNMNRMISTFARAHYSFDERYMVTATVRRDGSSKFGKNHKWGTFPSVSAAWGISQESFMKDITWINDLKLRAGYGVTGNQNGLGAYKSLELYGEYGVYYDSGSWLTSYRINQNANPDLKWESTAMLNIGLDFSLFKGRVGGTIEWYDKKTSDMLYRYQVPTPPYVYDRMMANVGDMSNKGIELLLNIDVVRNKTFSYNTSINLSHNKNKITKLSNDVYTTDELYVGDPWLRGGSGVISHIVKEGYPVGTFYLLECNEIVDGKYVIIDQNEDGKITDDDRKIVGNAQPDLTFGWNNNLRWNNFDMSLFFRGTIGNKVFNNPRAAYANNTYLIGTNALDDPLTYTMKESSRICSYYLEDASHIRLDNMSIGYTFNTKNIGWLDKARIYVAGQNLFVITGYKGTDPEVELYRGAATDDDAGLSPGIENRQFFPKSRSFTFGVNLTF